MYIVCVCVCVRSYRVNINKHSSQLKMVDYCRSCVSKVRYARFPNHTHSKLEISLSAHNGTYIGCKEGETEGAVPNRSDDSVENNHQTY